MSLTHPQSNDNMFIVQWCTKGKLMLLSQKSKKRKKVEGTLLDDSTHQHLPNNTQTHALIFHGVDGRLQFDDYTSVTNMFPPSSLLSLDTKYNDSTYFAPAAMTARDFHLNATVSQIAYLIETMHTRKVDSNVVWKTFAEGLQFCNMLSYMNLEACSWFTDNLEIAMTLQQKSVFYAAAPVNKDGTLYLRGRCRVWLDFAWKSEQRLPGNLCPVADEKRRILCERVHQLMRRVHEVIMNKQPDEPYYGCFLWIYKSTAFISLDAFQTFAEEFNQSVFAALQLPSRPTIFLQLVQ